MVIVLYLEFDKRVNESRMEAETALEKVSEIQESIAVAENKTGTAIEEIKDLEEMASSALFLAESAYNLTVKATKVSCPFAFCPTYCLALLYYRSVVIRSYDLFIC